VSGERNKSQALTRDLRTSNLPINRCDRCRRRLFDGFLFGVIKCPHCNRLSEFVDKKAEEEYHAARLNGRL